MSTTKACNTPTNIKKRKFTDVDWRSIIHLEQVHRFGKWYADNAMSWDLDREMPKICVVSGDYQDDRGNDVGSPEAYQWNFTEEHHTRMEQREMLAINFIFPKENEEKTKEKEIYERFRQIFPDLGQPQTLQQRHDARMEQYERIARDLESKPIRTAQQQMTLMQVRRLINLAVMDAVRNKLELNRTGDPKFNMRDVYYMTPPEGWIGSWDAKKRRV